MIVYLNRFFNSSFPFALTLLFKFSVPLTASIKITQPKASSKIEKDKQIITLRS